MSGSQITIVKDAQFCFWMIDLYDRYKHARSKHRDREHTDKETKKTTAAHHLGDFVNHYI
jgi:hypothetical protein